MKAMDKIRQYIQGKITAQDTLKKLEKEYDIGISAYEIEEELGIVRNNASTLLNQLFKDGELVKIGGRPVYFFPADIIEKINQRNDFRHSFTQKEIRDYLLNKEEIDPFKELVGYNYSLKNQIGQAKAAIMYPTNGLHMLILGDTGVGKTTFANKMYEYAKQKKNLDEDKYPFISFNCSDYYNNPQLLVSQLFGHAKGAYTGADTDKMGLVEKANGGILFLDEIHRLPPDGQEMLFYLIDNGSFKRLGETDKLRKSNVLIIAATTEDPNDNLLHTFIRRIPVIITLPSLKEKSISERVEIIENLFGREALRLQKPLKIEPEVLKALAIYNCKGNIGQLYSDIKLVCAKAFLGYLQNKEELKVDFSMLSNDIKNSIFDISKLDLNTQEYLNIFDSTIVIEPLDKEKHSVELIQENIYNILSEKLEELQSYGLSQEEVDIRINKYVQLFFKKVIKRFSPEKFNIRELYKVIDKRVVDVTVELIDLASENLNKSFSNKLLFGLAFHIQSVLERLKNKNYIVNSTFKETMKLYPKQWDVAKLMIERLNKEFDINIPRDEVGFVAVLLHNAQKEKKEDSKIGILIISHGENTATSMANVCNRLLNSNYVKGLDIPLDSKVSDLYSKALTMVKGINRGKGVLILADMGSVVNFGERITKETGIITRTIDRVSTPLVLEALRKVIYRNDDINTIYESLAQNKKITPSKRKKALISVCVTGQGTSIIAKNMLEDILQKSNVQNIEIIPLDYTVADVNSDEYIQTTKEYDVIACVGSFKPNIDVPFFHITEVLSEQMRASFIGYIETQLDFSIKNEDYTKDKSIYEEAKEILEKNLLFINVAMAIVYIEKFITTLSEKLNLEDKDTIFGLAVHMGCLLERVLQNNKVVFEGLKEYRQQHIKEFNLVKKEISHMEKIYHIEISDEEIAYILKIILIQK
jgi:transcriptional regulatory protein LevR/transcriptional regulator with AAA-type ATPase domain